MNAQTSKFYQAMSESLLTPSMYERFRSHLDRLCAAILIAMFGVPMTIVAFLLYLEDRGPALFRHYRVGRNGELFCCLKFRTMTKNSEVLLKELLERDPAAHVEWETYRKIKNDPRITAIGRFLRATSLDELPQLINVLRGEMALVGPRPITLDEVNRYGWSRWLYLRVRPGITGLWQVSGRNLTTFEKRITIDEEYVRNRTIWLDIAIIFRTIKVIFYREGAY